MESVFDTIADAAERESVLWAQALLPREQRQLLPVFSSLADDRFALALETIYEGYLLHYGRPRLFAPPDRDSAVLLGDYLYAHGLVRVTALGDVTVVADLAELISLCTQLRADGAVRSRSLDGAAWAGSAAALGRGGTPLAEARAVLRDAGDPAGLVRLAKAEAGGDAVARALALHAGRVH